MARRLDDNSDLTTRRLDGSTTLRLDGSTARRHDDDDVIDDDNDATTAVTTTTAVAASFTLPKVCLVHPNVTNRHSQKAIISHAE